MIGFLPLAILLGAAVIVVIVQFVPRGIGISWLLSVFLAMTAWLVLMILKPGMPYVFTGMYWLPIGINTLMPDLEINSITWQFAFFIVSLVIAGLLISSSRFGSDSNPTEWIGLLLIGAVGYVGVGSSNILTASLVFGFFSLLEVFVIFTSFNSKEINKSLLLNIGWKNSSTFLLLAAYGWQLSLNLTTDEWKFLQPIPVYLMIGAFLLRLGIFPFQTNRQQILDKKNGFQVVRNIIEFLMIVSICGQLPFYPLPPSIKIFFLGYLLVIGTISSTRIWRNREESQTGNFSMWLPFAGSMVIASTILGFGYAAISLGLTIAALGSIIFFIIQTNSLSKTAGIISLLGFSGIPMFPNAIGFSGFGLSQDFPGILFLISIVIFCVRAYFFIINRRIAEDVEQEQWTRLFSPLGLIFPVISTWVIFLPGFLSGSTPSYSLIGLLTFILILAFILVRRFRFFENSRFVTLIDEFFTKFKKYCTVLPGKRIISSLAHSPIYLILNLFEGEGGVLWSVLALVLIVTIARSIGGNP